MSEVGIGMLSTAREFVFAANERIQSRRAGADKAGSWELGAGWLAPSGSICG
jgi:hypothetical protein